MYAASAIATGNLSYFACKQTFRQLLREEPDIHFAFSRMMAERMRFKFMLLKNWPAPILNAGYHPVLPYFRDRIDLSAPMQPGTAHAPADRRHDGPARGNGHPHDQTTAAQRLGSDRPGKSVLLKHPIPIAFYDCNHNRPWTPRIYFA